MHSSKLIVLLAILFNHAHLSAEEKWLTPEERGFFHELGSHLFINGVPKSVAYRLGRIEVIAKESPEPLNEMISDFVKARQNRPTDRDRGSAMQHYVQGINEIHQQIAKDSKKLKGPAYEEQFLGLLANNSHIKRAWFDERDRLAKGLAALDAEQTALNAILDRITKRVPQAGKSPAFLVEAKSGVVHDGSEHLWIVCNPESAFADGAILQIIVHSTPAKGTWNANILHKNISFWWIGNDVSQRAQEQDAIVGKELTKLQEQAKDRPGIRTFMVPPMKKREEMRYDLMIPAALAHYTERIEIRGWCESGAFTIKSVEGLDKVRQRSTKAEADRIMSPREKLTPDALAGSGMPKGSTAGPFAQRDRQLQPGRKRGEQPGGMKLPPPPDGQLNLPEEKSVEPKDGRSVAKPESSTNLMYPGSLWKGVQKASRGGKDIPIELEVNRMMGQGFIGKFRGKVPQMGGLTSATAYGSISLNGEITINLQNEDHKSLFEYHGTIVNQKTFQGDVKLEGRAFFQFKLDYVPPK